MGSSSCKCLIERKKKSLEDEYKNSKVQLLIGFKENEKIKELNAILQCLCHIDELANYFIYKFKNIEKKQSYSLYHQSGNCLTDSLKNIFEKLWPKIKRKYQNEQIISKIEDSKEFLEMIYNVKPEYTENKENLLEIILLRLHQELNTANSINNQNEIKAEINIESAFKNYLRIFCENNKSIISDIFYGTYYEITFCKQCGNSFYIFKPYIYGFYFLNEIYQYKTSGNNTLYMNNNISFLNINEINIYDCLIFDQRLQDYQQMMNNNQQICNFCNTNAFCTYKNIIYIAPKILTFIFRYNIIFLQNIKFVIQEMININEIYQFVENPVNIKYYLIGMVYNVFEGHYVAYCKNPVDKQWYYYDDNNVEKKGGFQEIYPSIAYRFPFLLFYQAAK